MRPRAREPGPDHEPEWAYALSLLPFVWWIGEIAMAVEGLRRSVRRRRERRRQRRA